jgi:hypothetical protein
MTKRSLKKPKKIENTANLKVKTYLVMEKLCLANALYFSYYISLYVSFIHTFKSEELIFDNDLSCHIAKIEAFPKFKTKSGQVDIPFLQISDFLS